MHKQQHRIKSWYILFAASLLLPIKIPVVLRTDLRPAAFLKIVHDHRLVDVGTERDSRSIHSN